LTFINDYLAATTSL